MSPLELLIACADRGVVMWREGDRIRWRGADILPPSLRAEVKARRDDIYALLDVARLTQELDRKAGWLWEHRGTAAGGELDCPEEYEAALKEQDQLLAAYKHLMDWQQQTVRTA